MSDKSKIEWTDTTWSPVTGCTKVSDGCKNCYAEREVETRWSKNPKSVFYGRKFTDVRTHADQLEKPLQWKKPQRIFVCPRGDLFHESVPDEFLPEVFAVMAMAPRHTFQVLTKRPERMREVLNDGIFFEADEQTVKAMGGVLRDENWPLPNVWLGVSVENQTAADQRIPLLLKTLAAVRWVSAEPLLGRLDLCEHFGMWWNSTMQCFESTGTEFNKPHGQRGVDWVVAGGESGPNARTMHPDWVRALRDQCAAAGVPFLFKQWGEWIPMLGCVGGIPVRGEKFTHSDGTIMGWAGKKSAGRMLDGVLHDAYPEVRP